MSSNTGVASPRAILVCAIFFEEIKAIHQSNHDLSESKVLGQTFIGNVVDSPASCGTQGFEIFGLQGGDGAFGEGGMVGDAVDGFAFGYGFGDFFLSQLFVACLFVELRATGGHHLVKFLAGVRNAGDYFQDLFASELGLGS